MKITKSNNIGFDYLEYETILEALYFFVLAKRNFLMLTKFKLTEREIESYERKIEIAKKLQEQIYKSKCRYMEDCTNW